MSTTVPSPTTAATTAAALPELAASLDCLHLPGSAGYDVAVAAWNVAVPRLPVAVVAAREAGHVATAVAWADRHGVRVSVQATGHGAVGDLADTLLVSTKEMTGLSVDVENRTARAEAGVRWDQVVEAAAPHGLAGLVGSAPHVGVVGYTTGGGIGPVARTHGLASDKVCAFEVVTGDGVARRATATENPDLFWALRGGKGLLGIVTAVEFGLVPLAELYAGALYFDGDDAAAVLHRWVDWSRDLPREATTSVALLRLPPLPSVPPLLAGRLTVAVRFAWCGEAEAGAAALAPLRGAAAPIVDAVGVIPFAAIGAVHADPVDPMPTHEEHALLGALDHDAVDALLRAAGPGVESPQVIVELRQLGGAIGRRANTVSAYDQRDARFSLLTIGLGVPPVVDAVRADGQAVVAAVQGWTVPGRLPNFAPRDNAAWLTSTYSRATLARLARVARAHDPNGTIHGSAALRAADPAPLTRLRALLGR